MFNDPDKILISFPLIGGGRIEFGYAKYAGGMTVGTAPLMGRLIVTEGFGHYPDCWFKIQNQCGLIKLKSLFKEDQPNFIPEWLRADCYEGAYYRLAAELQKYDKTRKFSSD